VENKCKFNLIQAGSVRRKLKIDSWCSF